MQDVIIQTHEHSNYVPSKHFTPICDLTYDLKDNLPHNTCQIYVKPHSKNTQMTLEYHIFDEKALE